MYTVGLFDIPSSNSERWAVISAWEVDAGGGESAVIRTVHGRGGVQDARGRLEAGRLRLDHSTQYTIQTQQCCTVTSVVVITVTDRLPKADAAAGEQGKVKKSM